MLVPLNDHQLRQHFGVADALLKARGEHPGVGRAICVALVAQPTSDASSKSPLGAIETKRWMPV